MVKKKELEKLKSHGDLKNRSVDQKVSQDLSKVRARLKKFATKVKTYNTIKSYHDFKLVLDLLKTSKFCIKNPIS